MELISQIAFLLAIAAYIITTLVLMYLCKKLDVQEYETWGCRNARASMGMFAYMSDIEETWKRLNSRKSKF